MQRGKGCERAGQQLHFACAVELGHRTQEDAIAVEEDGRPGFHREEDTANRR